MAFRSRHKYARISPTKVRPVADLIRGKFVDEERPTFLDRMDEHYAARLGDEYLPMPPEGGMIHE